MFLRYKTSLRDPLYDYIPCTDFELNLIDTKAFQRLKRIAQTAGAKFVYPGSEHTRFSHSLGVMHLAGRMAEKLLVKEKMEKELGRDFYLLGRLRELCEKGKNGFPGMKKLSDTMFEIARKIEIIRIAGLLHDIGHCGFSHTLETILEKYQGIKHEDMAIRILKENDEIEEVFEKCAEAKFLGIDVKDIIEILSGRVKEDLYLCEIISGTFDADKIDYIARDAHHTGTIEYGAVDASRLTETLEIYGNALIPDSSVVDAVIDFWEARFNMFSAVYYHRVARAMEIIIQTMVDNFVVEYQNMHGSKRPETVLSNFLKINGVDDYLLLDDFSVVSELNRLRRERYKFELAFKFLDMYLKRKPLTCIDEYRLSLVDEKTWKMLIDPKRLETMGEQISKFSNVPKHFIFIDAPPKVDIKVNPVFGKSLKEIVVWDKRLKTIKSIEEFDPKIVDALSILRGVIRIYTLEEYQADVKKGWNKYKEEYLK
jgi:HD superfamily phosphohydrolase